MNITPAEIYWLTRLDEFRFMFGIIFTVLVVLVIANCIGAFVSLDQAHDAHVYGRGEEEKVQNGHAKRRLSRALRCGLMAMGLGLVVSFMPSTKQMAAIIIIPKLANSEIVAEMGDATKELIGLARDWMKTLAPSPKGQEEKP